MSRVVSQNGIQVMPWIARWMASLLVALPSVAWSAGPLTRADVESTMHPYDGPSVWESPAEGLKGRVVCGYQGWFTAPTDGAERGWTHYQKQGKFEPGHCSIDLWPDMTEYDEDERFATPFRHADGRVAQVFSSYHSKTVARHFRWMREYGIDGAMVQRFAVETRHPVALRHCTQVLRNARGAANQHGRVYCVMYDLSGLGENQIETVMEDWRRLVDRMRIGRDPKDRAYLRFRGKPLVAVWGIGFNDQRKYTLAECDRLIRWLRDDPHYGGQAVMVGVPAYWRTLDRDAVADTRLHELLSQVDIISPWTVGRFGTSAAAAKHGTNVWQEDIKWCRQRRIEYLPVAFPGFSWHNMRPQSPLNQIPRRGGEFLWSQYRAAHSAGATMMYQAMFDELDEGTAIFKCSPQPPVGASPFVAEPDLPSDHYLWLTGQGARLLRGELAPSDQLPARR